MSDVKNAEVIIVGGGPAGASCARQLGLAGVDYLLLDKSDFPRPKTCAGWVTPRVFSSLGITPQDYPHSLAHFTGFEIKIKDLPFHIKTDQYAIRRMEFDQWLLGHASATPIHHLVRSIIFENDRYIIDGQFTCRFLVGAGGTHCPVRKTFFLHGSHAPRSTLIAAMEEEFKWEYHDDRCHLWFMQNGLPGYAWYVPKPGGMLNVGIGGSVAGLKKQQKTLVQHWQFLIQNLEKCGLVRGHDFHPSGYSYYLRAGKSTGQTSNAFLAGDALGLATLDMGEGIGPAVESGKRVAWSIIHDEPFSLSGISRYSFPSLIGLRN